MTIDYRNDTLFDRAERGAAKLDREVPGWYDRIDLKTLNLESCYMCVFGQLYPGHYNEGENKFFGSGEDACELAAAHGFSLGDHDDTEKDEENWVILNDAWTELIEARRANSGTD